MATDNQTAERKRLKERFWTLIEPDLDAYSKRLNHMLDLVSMEKLAEYVAAMEPPDDDDDEDGIDFGDDDSV